MKKTILGLIAGAVGLLLAWPTFVQAHIGGLPFFQVNGVYTLSYPVPGFSVQGLVVAQDSAPEHYLAGQAINFSLDTKILQIPDSVVSQTHFLWDWGDGSQGSTGVTNTHTYARSGSYVITLQATTAADPTAPPQLFDSVLMNIVPGTGYGLPQAVLMVNGQQQTDPSTQDPLAFRPGTQLVFDASTSQGGGAKITDYIWNFGDGSATVHGAQVTHAYTDRPVAAPFLRIQTADGFISDAYVQLEFRPDAPMASVVPTMMAKPAAGGGSPILSPGKIWGGVLVLLVVVGGTVIVRKRRGQKRRIRPDDKI